LNFAYAGTITAARISGGVVSGECAFEIGAGRERHRDATARLVFGKVPALGAAEKIEAHRLN